MCRGAFQRSAFTGTPPLRTQADTGALRLREAAPRLRFPADKGCAPRQKFSAGRHFTPAQSGCPQQLCAQAKIAGQRGPAAHPAYRTRRKRLNSLYAPAQFDILRLKRDRRPPPLRACAKTCDRRSRSALRAAWHIGRALENSAAHRCFPLMGKRPRHACRAQTKTAAPGLRASELDII